MWSIKERKQLLVVELKDWTVLYSDKTLEVLEKWLNWESNFVMIDWVLFSKYEFKKAYEKKADDITTYKLSLPEDEKKIIAKREIKMKELWKYRESIDQIKRYIDSVKNPSGS